METPQQSHFSQEVLKQLLQQSVEGLEPQHKQPQMQAQTQ